MVFAIGGSTAVVSNGKLPMPVEYHLKKKTLFGTWIGDELLFISDEEKCVKAKNGDRVCEVVVDVNHYLHLDDRYNGVTATITGCVSTIQIELGGKHVSN